jgi:hypothetical protein
MYVRRRVVASPDKRVRRRWRGIKEKGRGIT